VNSLLLDLRNHGSSPHHPEHTYDAMIGDLHYLLTQRYGINTFSLMGHSMVRVARLDRGANVA
jgi:pimeloyl-ACP methyl ester carboxylesterase